MATLPDNHQHPETPSTKQAWLVTLTASLFLFYCFIQLNIFNSIDTALMRDFDLNATQLGQLAAMYFYANALFLLPAGSLLDRYSTKKLLTLATAACAVGTLMFAMATRYPLAACGRFLVGGSAAFCFLASIRIASRWFPPQKMATATGVIVVMAMLGGLVAQTPVALLTNYVNSWHTVMLLDAALGVMLCLSIAIIVQDHPPHVHEAAKIGKQHLQQLGLWRCIKLAALNPQNWLCGLYTSLMNLPVFLLGALWGIHYLIEVRHITLVQASYATTLFFIGVIVGSPLFGWFSDKIERRVLPMIVGAILSLLVILILMYTPTLSLSMIILLFFLIGLVTSSQILSYPVVAEVNPVYLTSTAVSIDSTCIMVSGFIFQPFFGWMMEHSGTHTVVDGVTVYTAQNFNYAMLIMPVAFIIGLLVTIWIRETYCRPQV